MGLLDLFKKNGNNIDGENCFDALVKTFEPSKDMKKPSEHILQACEKAGFPKELLDFMSEYGFGNFGDGILKLIDPEDYMNSLYTWLGGEDFTKIPFMMTGFGDLFYFRNLGDGEYDIALLDIHYRNISVPAYTCKEFVSFITDPDTQAKLLRKDLFAKAKEKCGAVSADEIYYFVPALAVGGGEDIKYIDKGKAAVHHQVLFQVGG